MGHVPCPMGFRLGLQIRSGLQRGTHLCGDGWSHTICDSDSACKRSLLCLGPRLLFSFQERISDRASAHGGFSARPVYRLNGSVRHLDTKFIALGRAPFLFYTNSYVPHHDIDLHAKAAAENLSQARPDWESKRLSHCHLSPK